MSIIGQIKLTTNKKIVISVNSERLNYNVHMKSSAYYSQLEVALVHELVYDIYCKNYAHVLSIYSSCDFLTAGATNKNYLQWV